MHAKGTVIACLALGACATADDIATVPLEAERLVGTWDLAEVGSRKISRAIWLEFRASGELHGGVSCNRFSGTYEVQPPRIVYSDPIIITAAGCGPGWPENGPLRERAEEVVFRDDPLVELSPDGRFLVMRGEADSLLFIRR